MSNFDGLYTAECNGTANTTITFAAMADAMMSFIEARQVVERISVEYGVSLGFVKLGLKDGEIEFRVFTKEKVSEKLKLELEEKTRFRKVRSGFGSFFCVDYAMKVYNHQYLKFERLTNI